MQPTSTTAEASEAAPGSDLPHRPEPPPLRIHHLMACAVVAAVQLSLWRVAIPHAAQFTGVNAVMVGIIYIFGAIGLTLALFSIYWQVNGLPGLVQPGQWLLVSYAVSALRFYVTILLLMAGTGPTVWLGSGQNT